MRDLKIGMSTACFFMREDTEKAVLEISSMGIKRCEIFLSGFSEYEKGFFAELVSIMDGEGMACSAIHALSMQFEPQLFSNHHRQRQDALDIFNRVLDGAGMLRAECYTMHGHFMLKNTDLHTDYEKSGERLAMLSSLATQRGVRLTLENVHYCMYNRCGLAAQLAPYVKGAPLGYTLDIKQAVRAGENPFDYLAEMGGRLANLHICGLTELSSTAPTCMPEYSVFDNKLLAERLRALNYEGPITLEVYPSDYKEYNELKKSIGYLESIYG